MSSTPFPHPQRDEADDDGFVTPNPALDSGAMGGATINPVEAQKAPQKRRALALFGGAILGLGIFFAVALRGGDGDNESTPPNAVAGSKDTTTKAATIAIDSTVFAPPLDSMAVAPTIDPSESSGAPDDFLNPEAIAEAQAQAQGAGQAPVTVTDPVTAFGSPTPGQTGGIAGAVGGIAGATLPTTAPTAGAPTAAELAQQAALDAKREAEAEAAARRQAFLEAVKAEETRLRGAATAVIAADAEMVQTRGAGASRFGAGTPGTPTGAGTAAGTGSAPGAPGAASSTGTTQNGYDILPGTQVSATTVSEFVSDVSGGSIEIRLSAPLRDRARRVILPAGTRAFGSASATGGEAGSPARVAITASVFVTPKGDVIRNLSGTAADPTTLARSVPGKVDGRYLERVVRGAATTIVDLAITQGSTSRPSAFEQPSPRDQAINDGRRRAGALISGPIGDENAVQRAIRLPANTPVILLFGL